MAFYFNMTFFFDWDNIQIQRNEENHANYQINLKNAVINVYSLYVDILKACLKVLPYWYFVKTGLSL